MASVITPTAPAVSPAPDPATRSRRTVVVVALVVVVVVVAVGRLLATGGSGAPGPLSSSLGISENRPVPASVLRIPLVNENGRATTLGAFRGKIVVLTS